MQVKKNLAALVIAVAFGSAAPVTFAEISGSVGVASTYLWRGLDLGSGTPAVSGDLNYSNAGVYSGVWVSSGDTAAGTEYDLYAGYGISFGADDMFSIDISLWNYNYPTGESSLFAGVGGPELQDGEVDFGELSELVVAFGAGPVALTIYDNVAGANGYYYYTLSGSVGKFGLTLGMHDFDGGDSPTHLNLDYSFNDNLVFTLSQFISDEDAIETALDPNDFSVTGNTDDDLKVVVSYSIPIEL